MFRVQRHASGRCEVRFDFQERLAEDVTSSERRTFIRLGPSLAAINAWLTTLAADAGYAPGTGYEYAKVLYHTVKGRRCLRFQSWVLPCPSP